MCDYVSKGVGREAVEGGGGGGVNSKSNWTISISVTARQAATDQTIWPNTFFLLWP